MRSQLYGDDRGRLVCQAQRMNPAAYGEQPGACALTTQGSQGPDRIARSAYDAASQLLTVEKAVGTPIAQVYARYEYTPNGKQKAVIDANGNRAEMTYDGLDRQKRWIFPSNSPGYANQADYEEYDYDAGGNRTSLRKRDGRTIYYQYDGANRLTLKSVPASASGAAGYAVYYGYDVAGLQTYARFGSASGPGITNAYDGLGRLLSSTSNMDGTARTVSSAYDAASNRTQVATSAGFDLRYSYDAAGRMTGLLDAMGTSLAAFTYDSAGRRSGLSFLGGVSTVAYSYDVLGRLSSLTHDLAGTAGDQTYGFTYNAASQIVTRSGTNDAYASNTAYAVTRNYTVNGLNQYTAAGPATFQYDANANLTNDGSTAFVYDAENRLVSASGAKNATLSYDPLGRLWQVAGASGTVRFLYDGDRLVEEYDASGNRLRMFAHGQGADEPLAWWENMGGSWQLRFLHADHQGSIVSLNDVSGNVLNISPYDTWGIPNAGNWGRFMYTGQVWLADLGLYYYKARMYSPTLGRFMQTDPVGYKDQVNLYAYVGSDPVNRTDPSGLYECTGKDCATIAKYYNAAKLALKGLDRKSDEAKHLRATLKFLGAPGVRNGVHVTSATLPPRTPGATEPGGLVKIDVSQIQASASGTSLTTANPGKSVGDIEAAYGGGVIAHEGSHSRFNHVFGPPNTEAKEYRSEQQGALAQQSVHEGLGISYPALWTPSMSPAEKAAAVDNAAALSTERWCRDGGPCY